MDFLQTRGKEIITEHGIATHLRGICVGGWLNFEDFINAYPGTETGIRGHIKQVLGEKKGELFFDQMTDHFFTENDIAFLAQTGINCVRLPLSIRHFESDDKPFVYKQRAFDRLDAVLDLCEQYHIYAILDLHSAPGWQNCHWHSDNERGAALLWRHPYFQERVIKFWAEMARHYADRSVVAGYELLNEPSTGNPNGEHSFDFYKNYHSDWDAINHLYQRITTAIRAIDSRHIIFLEGDNYGRGFAGLDEPFADNLVYSSHNYTNPGFGPGAYPGYYGGIYWDKNRHRLELETHEGYQYAQKYNVPLLIGEFGSQYHGTAEDIPSRLQSMRDQIDVYNEAGLNWTSWTYKDAGIMGLVTLNPESEYMRIVEPVQEMKRQLGAENFVAQYWDSPGRNKTHELARLILDTAQYTDLTVDDTAFTLNYAALTGFTAAMLQPAYAKRFANVTDADIERIMQAFAFDYCNINHAYVEILQSIFGN
ncbi:MAG: glycoside hydrolase family 5 protein [Clostridiales Family XIII bacterium]|jgi:aryl-phospho-beta-D-glucosidase BglC (GH1 family)|nr:glycoside hydrolase family 5 protein [Clostridiales Family XIII bacterium]